VGPCLESWAIFQSLPTSRSNRNLFIRNISSRYNQVSRHKFPPLPASHYRLGEDHRSLPPALCSVGLAPPRSPEAHIQSILNQPTTQVFQSLEANNQGYRPTLFLVPLFLDPRRKACRHTANRQHSAKIRCSAAKISALRWIRYPQLMRGGSSNPLDPGHSIQIVHAAPPVSSCFSSPASCWQDSSAQ
jgi:hypothetical protein